MPNLNYPAILKGTVITICLSLLLSSVISLIYHFSSVSEQTLPWSVTLIILISVFSGALLAGREASNSGLFHGLAVGMSFFLISWLVALLLAAPVETIPLIEKLLLSIAVGAMGGVVGVGSNS
ncbi:MAG: TIGR04086 family membrane protein [Peptococcaceae bacterium]|nr:MAG: TIGR04086 family membrane protein [Peptococcaceae bacterium]